MKKFIASLLLALSISPAMANNLVFGDWMINDNSTAMVNNYYEKSGDTVSLQVWAQGGIYLGFVKAGRQGDVGEQVEKFETVLTVNGKRVRFWAVTFQNDFRTMYPVTDEGAKYIAGELWDKTRVTFVNERGDKVWFSAKGIQQGWEYLSSVQAI